MKIAKHLTVFAALFYAAGSSMGEPPGGKYFKTPDGANLHYTVQGSGPTVIILSGGPGFASEVLRTAADKLATENEVVLFDQRGTGKSMDTKVDETTINLKMAVADLEGLRKDLKKDTAIFLGHSWGGILAMAYAADHPATTRALILVGSAGPNFQYATYFPANLNSRLLPSDLQAAEFWSDEERVKRDPKRASYERFRAKFPGYVFDRKHALDLVEQFKPEFDNPVVRDLMLGDLEKLQYDFTEKFKSFNQPVLIINGRQDPIGETTAYLIKSMMATGHLHFIERCGHYAWIEQPEAFFGALDEFLTKVK